MCTLARRIGKKTNKGHDYWYTCVDMMIRTDDGSSIDVYQKKCESMCESVKEKRLEKIIMVVPY